MKRFNRVLSITILTCFLLGLSACSGANFVNTPSDIDDDIAIDEIICEQREQLYLPSDNVDAYVIAVKNEETFNPIADADIVETNLSTETNSSASIGGDSRRCNTHSVFFCSDARFDPFISLEIICLDDFHAWALPLRPFWACPEDECVVNLVTFIEYFEIPREVFQYVMERSFYRELGVYINLDVLYSGDWALIEEHYSIANEELHRQLGLESRIYYSTIMLLDLQQVVNVNNTNRSMYFHDVWTFASLTPNMISDVAFWMLHLINRGEYDKVNIVELLNRNGWLTRPATVIDGMAFPSGREMFEELVNRHNMNLFTHYNIDIISSGDWELIEQYYAIENQAAHTAQVQAAFEQHVALYGMPDVNPQAQLAMHSATR